MHPLRYVVIINYTSLLNNTRKAHILGFFAEIENAQNAIEENIEARSKCAEEYGDKANKGYNALYLGNGDERFTYDIHDLCAEDWSCEACA